MRLEALVVVLAMYAAAHGQDALSPIRDAYRLAPTAEHVTIEVPRPGASPARSELVVAIRPGEAPAVALQLGAQRPMHVLAEPGRLLAWRADDPTRIFAAVLHEPFGPGAIESALPMVPAPQLALAFAKAEPLLTSVGELEWSSVEGEHRVVGVRGSGAQSVALTLWYTETGRLLEYEYKQGGRRIFHAKVRALDFDDARFEAPSLEGPSPPTLLDHLADLALPPKHIETGEPFGQAIGIDANGRPTTLRATAGPWQGPVVVLGIDARQADDRTRWAGALAEADLPALAEMLGVRLVVLVVGASDTASLVERVTWPVRGRGEPLRVLAIDAPPAWLGPWNSAAAWRVDGPSWTLRASHALPDARLESDPSDPFEASHAPLTLAERVRLLVGRAARGG